MSGDAQVLGLIAGQGVFPLDVARSARRARRRVACVAFRGQTDPRIETEVAEITWIYPGEVTAGIDAFRRAGVTEAVMAGKVGKVDLIEDPEGLHLEADAARLIESLPDRRDDSILGLVADFLESQGIRLLPQWSLVPELLGGEGPLGAVGPTPQQQADIAFGLPIAKTMGELDIGQTVVVRDRAVLAVEAIEGTDAAIRRAGRIAAGGVVVKVAKPHQDPRFDVPVIGPHTADVLIEARASALAFEAGATVVLDRDAIVARADAHGIVLVGVDPKRAAGGP